MGDLGVFDPDLYANGDPWRSGLPLDLFAELRDERPCGTGSPLSFAIKTPIPDRD